MSKSFYVVGVLFCSFALAACAPGKSGTGAQSSPMAQPDEMVQPSEIGKIADPVPEDRPFVFTCVVGSENSVNGEKGGIV